MAAGLPVVELYGENTIYDLPEDGCLLADGTPGSLAESILALLNDKNKRDKLSADGRSYMKEFPLKRGFEEFKEIVDKCFEGGSLKCKIEKTRYMKRPVISKKIYRNEDDVFFTSCEVDNRSPLRRKISKIKYILKEG